MVNDGSSNSEKLKTDTINDSVDKIIGFELPESTSNLDNPVESVISTVDSALESVEILSVEAQKRYLMDNSIVTKEGMSLGQTFYLLPPTENFYDTDFCKQLVHERCKSFSVCDEATEEELAGQTNALDDRFYQAIIFDETDGIACGYRINLLKDKSVECMYNSDLFDFSKEFSEKFKDVSLELGRSFMNVNYSNPDNARKGMMAFQNMFKGLHRTIRHFHEAGIPIENLIGSLSFSSQLGDFGLEVIQAYQKDFSAKNMGYNVCAKGSEQELLKSNSAHSVKEIINLVPRAQKSLVTLAKHYFELVDGGHAFAGPAIKNEARNCNEMYIHINLKGINAKKDNRFGDSEYSIREYLNPENSEA